MPEQLIYMDNFTKKVYRFIRERDLLSDGDNVVAGVSGGGDSVCLLTVLVKLSSVMHLHIRAVHVNHRLRPGAADEDQAYTQRLCEDLGIPCAVYTEDIGRMAEEEHLTEEEAGRIFRYRCFEKSAADMGGAKIAVAHHLDDQSETVLMNLFRGSGISGMAGIRERRGQIIRPLLCVRKSEIETYLDEQGISYCTDETNLQTDHTRNRIRLELLPYVRENINAEADRHIAGMADIISDIVTHIEKETAAAYSETVSSAPEDAGFEQGSLSIDSGKFAGLDRTMQREVIRSVIKETAGRLKDIEMAHIESVRKLFYGHTGGRLSLPYSLTALKSYNCIIIGRHTEEAREEVFHDIDIMLSGDEGAVINAGGIRIEWSVCGVQNNKNYHFPQKSYTKSFDYDKINNRLCLRHRRSGDFMIIRDGRRKLLRRIFIDDRIPAADRDKVMLLADGDHIVWIIDNGRISEYYKITDATEKVLNIQINKDIRQ